MHTFMAMCVQMHTFMAAHYGIYFFSLPLLHEIHGFDKVFLFFQEQCPRWGAQGVVKIEHKIKNRSENPRSGQNHLTIVKCNLAYSAKKGEI